MLAFTILCFTFLVSFVQASPLRQRDVWAPHITSPTANTVWTVGTKQTVTWDTSDKPAEITNPIGQIILGHEENGSLNLQFNSPLAQNFSLTDGKVELTVPDVPPRSDYLIVLFGDSGNTSPTFVIASISSGSSSTASSAATSASVTPSTSTVITDPIPITGSTITGGVPTSSTPSSITTSEFIITTSSSAPQTTSTAPASSSSSTASGTSSKPSSSGTGTGTSAASITTTTTSSGAWSLHRTRPLNLLCAGMASFVLTLVI